MKSLKYFIFFLFMPPSHKISSNQNAPDARSRYIRLTASYSSNIFTSSMELFLSFSLPSESWTVALLVEAVLIACVFLGLLYILA